LNGLGDVHIQNKGFLGTIDNKFSKAWTKKFCINNKELNFKIDTGADVTVIPISDNDFKGLKAFHSFCWVIVS
jgi:hypothetical protein